LHEWECRSRSIDLHDAISQQLELARVARLMQQNEVGSWRAGGVRRSSRLVPFGAKTQRLK
jgi:hypothetical protein